jgi:hypothetical protein
MKLFTIATLAAGAIDVGAINPMMMMMMQNGGFNGFQSNPLMSYILAKENKDSNMLPFLMMGGGMNNPMLMLNMLEQMDDNDVDGMIPLLMMQNPAFANNPAVELDPMF